MDYTRKAAKLQEGEELLSGKLRQMREKYVRGLVKREKMGDIN